MANLLSTGLGALLAHELTRSYRDNELASLNDKILLLNKNISELSSQLDTTKKEKLEMKIEMVKQHTLLFECLITKQGSPPEQAHQNKKG